jgi:hypothetical protein
MFKDPLAVFLSFFMKEKIITLCFLIASAGIGFFSAFLMPDDSATYQVQACPEPTFANFIFTRREGDRLFFQLEGDGQVFWGDDSIAVQSQTESELFLGQIPTDTDLALSDYPYLGNAKTGKFYPTDSYPARGTETRYRRFFDSRQAAIDAGFIPMKGI